MGSLIAPESLSAETAKGDNHGIKGASLDEQILEIDRELNGIGFSGEEIRGINDDNKRAELDGQHIQEGKNEGGAGFATGKGAEHVPNSSGSPNITKAIFQPDVCGQTSCSTRSGQ